MRIRNARTASQKELGHENQGPEKNGKNKKREGQFPPKLSPSTISTTPRPGIGKGCQGHIERAFAMGEGEISENGLTVVRVSECGNLQEDRRLKSRQRRQARKHRKKALARVISRKWHE